MINLVVRKDDDGIRPAGNPDECFYCHQKVGTNHNEKCPIIVKKVRIKYTFTIEQFVPAHWTKDDIEFSRNESSRCSNAALKDIILETWKTGNCCCGICKAEFIEDVKEEPARYSDDGNREQYQNGKWQDLIELYEEIEDIAEHICAFEIPSWLQ